jgi:hypothetical protein
MDFQILNIGMSTWLNLLKRVINGEFSPLTKFLPLDKPKTRKKRVAKKKTTSPGELVVKRKRGRPKKISPSDKSQTHRTNLTSLNL